MTLGRYGEASPFSPPCNGGKGWGWGWIVVFSILYGDAGSFVGAFVFNFSTSSKLGHPLMHATKYIIIIFINFC